MKKNIKVKPIRNFLKELDDPRLTHRILQEQQSASAQLDSIKKEREKIDIDIDKLNVELVKFKKYVHDKSFKIEDYIETIDECENIIRDEKIKQENYHKNIKSIRIDTKKLDEISQDAKSRIESYKPYEACYRFMSTILVEQYYNVKTIPKIVLFTLYR
ncbi:uncharacterized protein LOC115033271 [Acyrthosiphon pisum]|uniref:Uncharacterized protein n=1 Tax=Acyrthosiphon pisum TaxID=7029 RepID=A0A8R2NJR7_ACYPI|nr:uncharacterized protein LOC115033271 [Acyrthosiphon pisum]